MKDYIIVIKLPDDNKCNGCLFFRHKNIGRDILYCMISNQVALDAGKKDNDTQRPAQCPLVQR